jgi:spectinomycin phosphotransferase
MTNEQWRELGTIFKQIHQVTVPAEGFESLRRETFDAAEYVRWIGAFESHHLHTRPVGSPSQGQLIAGWLAHQDTIHTAARSLEKLSAVLQKQAGPYVICHADLHPANLIRDSHGRVFVIDWDDVMLAPKERDFIFIREPEAQAFWEGYEQPEVDWIALTYYRLERVVQDVIACADDMFFKDDLGEEARAEIAGLMHEILVGSMSTINDVYAAAAHLPADLIL